MLAVKLDREDAVELLLKNGANPFLKDKLGQEAADYRYSMNRADIYSSRIMTLIKEYKEIWQGDKGENTELAQ